MRLHASPFAKIADGTKTAEARLLDDKREAINVGDTIVFESRADGTRVKATVAELVVSPSFAALYGQLGPEAFGWDTTEEGLTALRQHYSLEDEYEHDVVGIMLKDIRKEEA